MTRFWTVVHNCVAHPLLLVECGWTTRFHDWTAEKMVAIDSQAKK